MDINDTNLKKTYEKETQASSELVTNIMSKNNFPTSGILGFNNIHDIRNKGSSSGSDQTPDLICNYNIVYQMAFSSGGVSSGFNGSHDLVHGIIGNMYCCYYP